MFFYLFLFLFSEPLNLADSQITLYDLHQRGPIGQVPQTKGAICFTVGSVINPLGNTKIPASPKPIIMAVSIEKGFVTSSS